MSAEELAEIVYFHPQNAVDFDPPWVAGRREPGASKKCSLPLVQRTITSQAALGHFTNSGPLVIITT